MGLMCPDYFSPARKMRSEDETPVGHQSQITLWLSLAGQRTRLSICGRVI